MSIIRKLIIAICIMTFVAFGAFNAWHYMSRDVDPPKISMDKEEISVSIKAGDEELLKGIKAVDAREGDVTATLGVEKLSAFGADGDRRMRVVAFDSKGNIGRAVRKVKYTDYTHPRFSLDGPLRVTNMNSGMDSLNHMVHVHDCLDGDITDRMGVHIEEKAEDGGRSGDYPVVFEVTNSAGDTQKIECTVTFYEQQMSNQIPLPVLDEYIVYTETGDELDPHDYLKEVVYLGRDYKIVGEGGAFGGGGGQEATINRDRIKISDDNVDYDKPGSYEIEYSVTDDLGNTGVTRLIVVVEDRQ